MKFVFRPEKPTYPLEISSLNLGDAWIEVYVLTNKEVKDGNNILNVDDSKKIDSYLKSRLEEYLNMSNEEYVTRLTYNGSLSQLSNDADFIEQYSWLEKIFNWIASLFSNLFK